MKTITAPVMTKYEYTSLLATRSLQISNNSKIYTELDENKSMSALEIAKKELREKKFPLSLRRRLPNGQIEDFCLDQMIIPFL